MVATILQNLNYQEHVQWIPFHATNSNYCFQVVEAAILDLLTRQGDRNSGNVFISESGKITLIDNNSVFASKVSSIMLPGTRLHTKSLLGQKFIRTGKTEDRAKLPLLSSRLDYRCHSNGNIGKVYPPGMKKCMEKIRSFDARRIMHELGLESISMAKILIQSATDLLEKGFEWTLYKGGPSREGSKYYPQERCCGFDPSLSRRKNTYLCEERWNPNANIDE